MPAGMSTYTGPVRRHDNDMRLRSDKMSGEDAHAGDVLGKRSTSVHRVTDGEEETSGQSTFDNGGFL